MAKNYHITGAVAHNRIEPLLPKDWTVWKKEESKDTTDANNAPVDFLWENTPRLYTKEWRNTVRCYSHLPNGSILDSKWVLGRLVMAKDNDEGEDPDLARLETHCFTGTQGYETFAKRVDLPNSPPTTSITSADGFRDLLPEYDSSSPPTSLASGNNSWWVIKDAWANGAGGVWVVSHYDTTLPLYDTHAYIAQRYAWPPVLYGGRKCHVRVYAVLTSEGAAHVHHRCFLHVANQPFTLVDAKESAVHITNCCANSHDADKFAGEICANLRAPTDESTTEVDLAEYAPSIYASVAALARRSFPFLRGGEANGGFEYLGLDFILSHELETGKPLAYLLEVNAPPSQDTATGLAHAEDLHDTVLRDLLSLWVYPKVMPGEPVRPGGWHCVYTEPSVGLDIIPSKAAILNKIRWTLYERKLQSSTATQEAETCKEPLVLKNVDAFANFCRSFFPFYSTPELSTHQATGPPKIFLENAGGTQVPETVIAAMVDSLRVRHRCRIGADSVKQAKRVLSTFLGVSQDEYAVFFGANASSLLWSLSKQYNLQPTDEVVVALHNHLANVKPWMELCRVSGATFRWWNPQTQAIQDVVSSQTRILAVPHGSNVTGELLNLVEIRQAIGDTVHLVVDGVAAVPHIPAEAMHADWYVVSLHKVFGPHLGVLCGRWASTRNMDCTGIQTGTVNFEACAGVLGLGRYLMEISYYQADDDAKPSEELTRAGLAQAYARIRQVEDDLLAYLLDRLHQVPHVRVLRLGVDNRVRLPIVSFCHSSLSSRHITDHCYANGAVCRHGTFLSTDVFLQSQNIPTDFVRLSMAHYNTHADIHQTLQVLEKLPGWQ